jgi:phosphohistidine phosphatase
LTFNGECSGKVTALFLSLDMKTLYIVRHAKSSWAESGLSDFDRPLNERGKRDAPRMGKRLKEKNIHPNLMLTSPAKRAWSTCKRLAATLGYAEEKIKTDSTLYHADEEDILAVIRNVNDKHNSLMVFGHNPGLTDFVNSMSHNSTIDIDNIPTCGIVVFNLDITSWKDVAFGKGEFVFFDYPKRKED